MLAYLTIFVIRTVEHKVMYKYIQMPFAFTPHTGTGYLLLAPCSPSQSAWTDRLVSLMPINIPLCH